MLKVVIFDLDDTLYDYETININAIEELRQFTCTKLKISKELFDKAFKWGREQTKLKMPECASQHNRIIYCQKTLEYLGINPVSYALEMYEVYWASMLQNMQLNRGIKEVFDFLKGNNIKIAICTDLTTHIQHRKLKKLGIAEYIDCIVCSEEVGEEKPSPKMFRSVLDKLKVEAAQAIYVGDSFEKDVIGASNLGIRTLWYNPKKQKCKRQDVKYEEIQSMKQLEEKFLLMM